MLPGECGLVEDGQFYTVLLSKGHGLLPGRLSGSNWYLTGRFSCRSIVGQVTRTGNIYAGTMILCAAVLSVLLVIGGVELNAEPVENIVQVLCSGCDRDSM